MVPFLLFGPQGLRRGCRDYVPFPFTATVCFPGSWRNNSLAMGVPREEGGWTLRNGTGRYTLLWALATDVRGYRWALLRHRWKGPRFGGGGIKKRFQGYDKRVIR